jgi:hypothetical protein
MASKKKGLEAKIVKHAHRRAFYDSVRGLGKKRFAMGHVYWYMFLRSGKGNMFELAEDLMRADLDMDHSTLYAVLKNLQHIGWLKKHRPRDTKTGRMGVITWEVMTTVGKADGGEESTVVLPDVGSATVGSATVGKPDTTVVLHSQYADASTSSSTPSASTPSEVVSQSVSESVSEACASPSDTPKEETNPYLALSEQAQIILDCIYPRFNPTYSEVAHLIPKLEEVAEANLFDYDGWKAFFRWNRTHKPAPLVFRALEQFLKGVGYAMNDFADHANIPACPVCKRLGQEPKPVTCIQCGSSEGSTDWMNHCASCWDAANAEGHRHALEAEQIRRLKHDQMLNPGNYPKARAAAAESFDEEGA